jgi:Reverse transcriptase (RNA-dependent DNA polymerase)
MSMKRGLKHFKKKGLEALMAEMSQLHYRKTIKPIFADSLTREQKLQALRYLMFLKEKRCGRIKARGCADGRKQRLWKTKEETSSPTVRTHSLFLTAIIAALEGRKVVTVDIPGAFMQTDIDELIHVKLEDELVDVLLMVEPKYAEFVTNENGKKVLYVELQKALYGTLQASLLFWKELSTFLVKELGFEFNPYDKCVVNKMIDGKQCTIIWHVDDLMLTHVQQEVLDHIVSELSKKFGKEDPLSVHTGDVHDYLGMTIDFSGEGKVVFRMVDYIQNMLDELPDDFDGTAATPATSYLFKTRESATKLGVELSDLFHSNVAKLLYLAQRARPDILVTVAFLTTRVSSPDIDDLGKLKRVMRYLRDTEDLPLTLEASGDGAIRWWVDASFAVHPNMRSHTGAVLSLGKGAVFGMSSKQKINTKSSCEAELVGVDDALPTILWTLQFLKAQGFAVSDNVVYQDNQSAILLEKNGTRSSGKRTRHLDIRYFFITDRVDRKEVRIEYCPTEHMRADPHTKPLQGRLFREHRDWLLNVTTPNQVVESQECVGNRLVREQNWVADRSVSELATNVNNSDEVANNKSGLECDESGWTIVSKKVKGRFKK